MTEPGATHALIQDENDNGVLEVLGDLRFVSFPRWSPTSQRLYLSDIAGGRVISCSASGSEQREEFQAQGGKTGCAGIGLSPEGSLRVVQGVHNGICSDPSLDHGGDVEQKDQRAILSVNKHTLKIGDKAKIRGRLAGIVAGLVTLTGIRFDKYDVQTESGTVISVAHCDLEPQHVKIEPEKASLHAELDPHIMGNEMPSDACMDVLGNAYVSSNAIDDDASHETPLLLVRPNGNVEPSGADSLFCAKGQVITPDGRSLIVAETQANSIAAYDRDPVSGRLSNKRVWASLPQLSPTGLCLDAEGCVWVGLDFSMRLEPRIGEDLSSRGFWETCCFMTCYYGCCMRPQWDAVLRIAEGGQCVDMVPLSKERGVACMLGGPQFRTLFITANKNSVHYSDCEAGNGRVLAVEVEVPAAQIMTEPRYCAGFCF